MKLFNLGVENHPILGNMTLDFTENGKIVDTIILAGENGCGKTTILELIHSLGNYVNVISGEKVFFTALIDDITKNKFEKLGINHHSCYKFYYEIERNPNLRGKIIFYDENNNVLHSINGPYLINFDDVYLTAEISFLSSGISSITAKTFDEEINNKVISSRNLGAEITQLIVDIYTQDSNEFKAKYSKNPRGNYTEEEVSPKIFRFNNAFKNFFEREFKIIDVRAETGNQNVIFLNSGKEVKINNLSSGEKQIVFRGGFLLKDKNSLNGMLILIDEPEISLHPNWHKKILNFYKDIFNKGNNELSSQIFVTTHSPFLIHNNNRYNDKVIILKKDENGNIKVEDNPSYYYCNSTKLVEKAFDLKDFYEEDVPVVFLEGETDEIYFNKAVEIFKLDLPYKFKWIGGKTEKGKDFNTGKDALNRVFDFLKAQNPNRKFVLLYDSDTKVTEENFNNVFKLVMPFYDNSKNIKIGIENALVLDDIEELKMEDYQSFKECLNDYGCPMKIPDFKKMKFANDICKLDNESLKKIFINLKAQIDRINKIMQ